MPKPNTLTFPLSPTAIIFLGHSNSKMLHHLHFSYHSMSWTVLHDASKVLFKPLLNFALGFSEVRYTQLIKLVFQKKIQIPSLANLTGRKLRNDEAMLNFLIRDRLGTSWLVVKERGVGHGWLIHLVFISDWAFWLKEGWSRLVS